MFWATRPQEGVTLRPWFGSFEGATALSGLLHAIGFMAIASLTRPGLILQSENAYPFKSGVQVSLIDGPPGRTTRNFGRSSSQSIAKASSVPASSQGAGEQGISSEAQSSGAIIPEYPREARLKGKEGRVEIEAEINEQGIVLNTRTISGDSELAQSALNALHSARFSPALGPQGPISSVKRFSFVFKLN